MCYKNLMGKKHIVIIVKHRRKQVIKRNILDPIVINSKIQKNKKHMLKKINIRTSFSMIHTLGRATNVEDLQMDKIFILI